jgi:hypothetical protein
MSHNNPCIWQLSQQWRGKPVDVDGDEERRAGGVAVLGDDEFPEDVAPDAALDNGSEDVRDTAEGTVGEREKPQVDDMSAGVPDDIAAADDGDAELTEVVAEPVDETVTDETATDETVTDETVTDETATDETSLDESAEADVPATGEPAADASPEQAEAAEPDAAVPVEVPVRRKRSFRRVAAIAAVVLAAALAVSAFATSGSPATTPDQHFVDTARTQGFTVTPGQQESMLVSAAHKICDRRVSHSTTAERRATALSTDELDAVSQSFGANARAFTTLALDTYCSS